MSNPGESDPTPITSTRQMAEWFAAGCKPKSAWRIGTEHEKFGFRLTDYAPPPYEPQGIRAKPHTGKRIVDSCNSTYLDSCSHARIPVDGSIIRANSGKFHSGA